MEQRSQSLVYLDTHIVVWLYAGLLDKFIPKAKAGIQINGIIRLFTKPSTLNSEPLNIGNL